MHYLKDWDKMFKEVSNVLKSGGYFIFSTGNPVAEARKKMERINGPELPEAESKAKPGEPRDDGGEGR